MWIKKTERGIVLYSMDVACLTATSSCQDENYIKVNLNILHLSFFPRTAFNSAEIL